MKDDKDSSSKKNNSDLEEAKAPLNTIEDCYEMLDIYLQLETPTFDSIQHSYRHLLHKYNPEKTGISFGAVEYRTLMKEKVKQAYVRVCDALGKDPEQGLEETEESLIAERDNLLEGWAGHWCGTPMMYIRDEYDERIEALRNKTESK